MSVVPPVINRVGVIAVAEVAQVPLTQTQRVESGGTVAPDQSVAQTPDRPAGPDIRSPVEPGGDVVVERLCILGGTAAVGLLYLCHDHSLHPNPFFVGKR